MPTICLLSMEIFEILDETGQQNALKQYVMTFLNGRKAPDKDSAAIADRHPGASSCPPGDRPGRSTRT